MNGDYNSQDAGDLTPSRSSVKKVSIGQYGNIRQMLSVIGQRRENLDLKFVCNDGKMRAHRLVIGAQSKYLRQIMKDAEVDDEIIIHLPQINIKTLKTVLKFLYTGKLYIARNDVDVIKDLLEKVLKIDAKITLPSNESLGPAPSRSNGDRRSGGGSSGGGPGANHGTNRPNGDFSAARKAPQNSTSESSSKNLSESSPNSHNPGSIDKKVPSTIDGSGPVKIDPAEVTEDPYEAPPSPPDSLDGGGNDIAEALEDLKAEVANTLKNAEEVTESQSNDQETALAETGTNEQDQADTNDESGKENFDEPTELDEKVGVQVESDEDKDGPEMIFGTPDAPGVIAKHTAPTGRRVKGERLKRPLRDGSNDEDKEREDKYLGTGFAAKSTRGRTIKKRRFSKEGEEIPKYMEEFLYPSESSDTDIHSETPDPTEILPGPSSPAESQQSVEVIQEVIDVEEHDPDDPGEGPSSGPATRGSRSRMMSSFEPQTDLPPSVYNEEDGDGASYLAGLPTYLPPPMPMAPEPGMVIHQGKWVSTATKARIEANKKSSSTVRKYNYRPFVTISGQSKQTTVDAQVQDVIGEFPCPFADCYATFERQRSLDVHLSRKHHPNPKASCPECGKSLSTRAAIKKHLLSHRPESDWPFFCPLPGCGKKFQAKGDLPKHFHTSKHRNEVPAVGSQEWIDLCNSGICIPGMAGAHQGRRHAGEHFVSANVLAGDLEVVNERDEEEIVTVAEEDLEEQEGGPPT